MRILPSSLPSIWIWMVICVITYASAYFIVDEPQTNTQWVNNVPNLVTWTKGLEDGISSFDLQMTQMNVDGLTLIALNIPATTSNLNLLLMDVPPGNGYYLIFINSTGGNMYARSPQFTILAQSATPSPSPPSPVANAPTVTVSGAPYPTQPYATTFPAVANGALALFAANQGKGLLLTLLGCIFGAFLTLGWW